MRSDRRNISSFLCFKHFLSHFSNASIAVVMKGNRAYNRVCKFASRFDRFPSERNTVQVKLSVIPCLFVCSPASMILLPPRTILLRTDSSQSGRLSLASPFPFTMPSVAFYKL
ncbi:hypothetical protein ISCGN_030915 [Ixodes scapularis]